MTTALVKKFLLFTVATCVALVEKLKHVATVNKRIFFTSKFVLAEERSVLGFIPDYFQLSSAI